MTFRELTSSEFYVSLLAALDRARSSDAEAAPSEPPLWLLDTSDDDFQDTVPASWIVSATDKKSAAS